MHNHRRIIIARFILDNVSDYTRAIYNALLTTNSNPSHRVVVSTLALINVVNRHRARLVTVCGRANRLGM